jgi:hypothetical protein
MQPIGTDLLYKEDHTTVLYRNLKQYSYNLVPGQPHFVMMFCEYLDTTT